MVSCNLKTKKADKKQTPHVLKTTSDSSEAVLEAPASEQTQSKLTQEISIENLYLALTEKDTTAFFRQFPKDFHQFQSYFGWNTPDDAPHELYEHSVHYIEYFFYLLRSGNHAEQEEILINICTNGAWEADGVNYFQNHTLQYLKEKNRYSLINDLDDTQAKSVLFFLFDGPHPKYDADFAAQLNPAKKTLLESLFASKFSQGYNAQTYRLSDYEGMEHYTITDIDINKDGKLDKVVSADPYQGDELLLFLYGKNGYEFALKTRNFSEDGGHQITSVIADENGFVVITAFPDRGFFEAHHHIALKKGRWILTHTVYKTASGQEQDHSISVCQVPQGIDLGNGNDPILLHGLPDEDERNRICTNEKRVTRANIDVQSVQEIKAYVETPFPSIYEYYQIERTEPEAIWSNKMFGRCCSETDMSYAELLTFDIQAQTSQTQYPASHLSDQLYWTAFVFTENSPPEIKLLLKRDNALHKSHTQLDIDQVLQPNDTLLYPFKLSLVNGYAKSHKTYTENGRVKLLEVFLNGEYQSRVHLQDTPVVQSFGLDFMFTKNDVVSLVPISFYTGSTFDDVCISEIQSSLGQIAHHSINQKYVIQELSEKTKKIKNED
ncbi:hypothetical protein B7P33_01815 [Sediminicola luteus]|uniref:NAD glycohydrolase translocation F5/8 type C domain-containing protein n=1 Tax=Sediminicola luteus TaxID=319238 RepID=A0A2A4GC80_9FLAO|nr:hypothetical protein B7P33_01815 [Sediminicola luteus]